MELKLVLYQLVGTVKNVLESKHKIIRDIFLPLKSENGNISDTIAAQQSIRISNDLYGNDLCSSYELAKGSQDLSKMGKFQKLFHMIC